MWWFLSSCEGDAFGANDEACKVFYVSKFYAKNKFEKKWMDVRTKFLKEFLNRHNAPTRHEIEQRRNLTSTSGTFCSKTINELRKMVSKLMLLMLLAINALFSFKGFDVPQNFQMSDQQLLYSLNQNIINISQK